MFKEYGQTLVPIKHPTMEVYMYVEHKFDYAKVTQECHENDPEWQKLPGVEYRVWILGYKYNLYSPNLDCIVQAFVNAGMQEIESRTLFDIYKDSLGLWGW